MPADSSFDLQLHLYILRYRHVDNLDELLQVVDWPYLAGLVGTSDKNALASKIEEAYLEVKEEIYTSAIFLDEELENVSVLAHIDGNPYHKEIDDFLRGLGVPAGSKKPEPWVARTTAPPNHRISVSSVSESIPETLQSPSRQIDLHSPHNRPRNLSRHTAPLVAPLKTLILGAPTLSTPASTEMTSLNVLTKAGDLPITSSKPLFNPAASSLSKSSFETAARKLVSIRRMSFGLPAKSARALKQPAAQPSNDKSPFNSNFNSKSNSNNGTSGVEADLLKAAKAKRRTSMVEDTLPLYIRKQLELLKPEKVTPNADPDSATIQFSKTAVTPNKAVPKPVAVDSVILTLLVKSSSRLRNVLRNSQSLYTISKNTSLPPSRGESQISSADTAGDREAAFDLDEEDKEYILPSLMSPYLGYQADDNLVDYSSVGYVHLSYEEEEDDDNDSFEEDDEDDENDDEDLHEQYLFK